MSTLKIEGFEPYTYRGIKVHGVRNVKQGDVDLFDIKEMLDRQIKDTKKWYKERTITEAKVGLRIDNAEYWAIRNFFEYRLGNHVVRKISLVYELTLANATVKSDFGHVSTSTKLLLNRSKIVPKLINKPIKEILDILFEPIHTYRVIDLITNMTLIDRKLDECVMLNCGRTDCKLSITWTNSSNLVDYLIEYFVVRNNYRLIPFLCYEYEVEESKYHSYTTKTGKTTKSWVCTI